MLRRSSVGAHHHDQEPASGVGGGGGLEISLKNCHDAGGLAGIERLLGAAPRARRVHLDRTRSVAHVTIDPQATSPEALHEALGLMLASIVVEQCRRRGSFGGRGRWRPSRRTASDSWVEIIEGSGVNHGWTDYRNNHLKPELAEMQHLRFRFFDIAPQVRGTVAWAPFRYELATDTPQGHVEVEGRGTAILERRDGRWLVVHLHTSGRRKTPGG